MKIPNSLERRVPALLLAAALATQLWAQEPTQPAVHSDFQKVDATITAIDPDARMVTLQAPHRTVTVGVSPGVKNFDKLKVGDTVTVGYYQGFAARIKKGSTIVSEPAASSFKLPAQNNGHPGGGAGESVTTNVTIEDIDPTTNTVAIKRSDGAVRIIAVRAPNMREFIRTLKRGDVVEVTYTESLAINVEPTGKSVREATGTAH